ncbi:hypothetical protein [Pseudoxanthomonas beigongshangi]
MNRLLFVLLGLLTLFAALRAEAGPNVPQCTAATCDQGEAYSAATGRSPVVCADEWGGGETAVIETRTDSGWSWDFSVQCFGRGGGFVGWKFVSEPYGKKCSQRAPSSGGFFLGGHQSSCSSGCRYSAGTITNRLSVGGKTYYQSSGAVPTGEVCSYQETNDDQPVTQDDCTQAGTLTQCVTKDGKHCAMASSGKRFCWAPTEAGTKLSGNEAATKAPEGMNINAPPKAPANGGEWQQGGQGTVSAGSGNTTNNYSVTNWNSTYGSQGNGANGGGAEGEGNGGDGEGEEDDGFGEPGEGVGSLYDGTDKTIGGLMSNFWAQVNNTDIAQGVTHFMGVGNGGGACPVFTVPASSYWESMTFDAHCSGQWLSLLQAMGWIVFAIASYIAVRIAVT